MTENTLKTARSIKTAGLVRTVCAEPKSPPFFFGVKIVTLPVNAASPVNAAAGRIKNITNNLGFYNQVIVKISLLHRAQAYGGTASPLGYAPDVRAFAREMIDLELRRETDREIAVMARGENIAANQRRQKMLGRYLLSKPYSVIRNFYGVQMQKLVAGTLREPRRESEAFYSDIIHKRVDKTVHSPAQTHVEHVSAPPSPLPRISGTDLNRIAAQAARQVEKKMRVERERNGKW